MKNVFLDLFGVVCDLTVMRKNYSRVMVSLLRQWYGGDRERWLRADEKAFSWYSKQWSAAQQTGGEYLKVWRETNVEHLRRLFREARIPLPLTDEEIFELDRKLTGEVTSRIDAAYPDAKESIRKIKSRGSKTYLTTGSDNLYVEGLLKASGLDEFFDGALTSNLLNEWKGTKEYWCRAIKLVRSKPQECLVVDDSTDFLLNARLVGCMIAWCNRARKTVEDSFTPDFEISNLGDLPAIIRT